MKPFRDCPVARSELEREEVDGGLIRYQLTEHHVHDDDWWSFQTRTTIAVPAGTSFEEARDRSQVFTTPDAQWPSYSHHSFRGPDGEKAWSWYVNKFPDGSSSLYSVGQKSKPQEKSEHGQD